jgi:hypothetical protein
MTPEPRMSYVRNVDKTWWLGAGGLPERAQGKFTIFIAHHFKRDTSALFINKCQESHDVFITES